jgi:hypothetical protein
MSIGDKWGTREMYCFCDFLIFETLVFLFFLILHARPELEPDAPDTNLLTNKLVNLLANKLVN